MRPDLLSQHIACLLLCVTQSRLSKMNRFVYYCVLGVILLLLEPPGYVSLRWSRSTSTSGAMGGLSLLFDPCDSGCQCYDQEDDQENDTMKKSFMVVCKHSDLSW